MIDLTLNSLLVPDILGYDPPFGSKITTTPKNKGGLSTQQVNDNILLPFAKQRAVIVEQSDTTSRVEYDAKLLLKNKEQEETLTIIIDEASYPGCLVSIYSLFDNEIVFNSNPKKIKKGMTMNLLYDGTNWQDITPQSSQPEGTRTLVETITEDKSVELEPGWYEFVVVGGGGGGGAQSVLCNGGGGGGSGDVKFVQAKIQSKKTVSCKIGLKAPLGTHGNPSRIFSDIFDVIAVGGRAGGFSNDDTITCPGGTGFACGGDSGQSGQNSYSVGGAKAKHGNGYGSGGAGKQAANPQSYPDYAGGGAGGYGSYTHSNENEGAPGVVEIYKYIE